MVNKNQLLRRLMALGCLLLLCFGLAGAQLVQLQIVNGESYLHRSAEFLTTTSTVSAARGEILDRYGRPMVTNQTGFSLVLIYASFWEDKEDRFTKLLDLAHRVQADGSAAQGDASADDADETADEEEILETAEGTEESDAGGAVLNDMLPITDTAPFAYVGESDDRTELSAYIKESASTLGLEELQQAKEAARAANEQDPQYDAEGNEIDQEAALDATEIVSASEFIDAMRAYLEENAYLPTGLSDEDVRLLVGLYYSMRQVSFSNTTTFTLADNVSMDLIAYIKEHHQDYEGVDVESKAVRSYDTDSAAHILGTVGSVDYEEWNGDKNGGPYREKAGYLMSDDIGKSGLEAALESYLHGTAARARSRPTSAAARCWRTKTPTRPSRATMSSPPSIWSCSRWRRTRWPTTSPATDGAARRSRSTRTRARCWSWRPIRPMIWRITTAIMTRSARIPAVPSSTAPRAACIRPARRSRCSPRSPRSRRGLIDANTSFTCTGKFEYGGSTFACNNHDTPMTMDVTTAIKYSCNTYFYNVGLLLTGAHLEQWCDRFGLGNVTGIEIGERAGHAAGPTYREEQRKTDPDQREWMGGDDVNAAIGQSDNSFTPLQLANYMAGGRQRRHAVQAHAGAQHQDL